MEGNEMKSTHIHTRTSPATLSRFKRAAAAMGVSLAEFVERAGHALADKVLTPGGDAEVVIRYGEGIEEIYPLPPEVNSGNAHEVARHLLLAVYERGGNALDLAAAEWEVRSVNNVAGLDGSGVKK